jgi:hypothetical protein
MLLIALAAWPAWAQGLGSDDSELPTDLSRVVGQLVQGACSRDLKTSQAAATALGDLQQACCQPLMDAVDSGDPEISARVEEIMRDTLLQAALAGASRDLSPEMRLQLERLIRQRRQSIEGCFLGDENERTAAIFRLRQGTWRDKPLEPVLLALLNSQSLDNAAAAAMVAGELNYNSEAVADAITQALMRSALAGNRANIDYRYQRQTYFMNMGGTTMPLVTCLQSMGEKCRKAAPLLLSMVLDPDANSKQIPVAPLADVLAASGEVGIIPTLLTKLDASSQIVNSNIGVAKVNTRRSDLVFYVLLTTTKQGYSTYNAVDMATVGYANPYMSPLGFAGDEARKAAYDKFRDWWAKAGEKAPYKGAKPIELVKLSDWNRKPVAPASAQTASSPASGAAEEPGLPQIADIQDRLRAVVRKQVEDLGSPRQVRRRNAQSAILAIQNGFFNTIASQVTQEDPAVASQVLDQVMSEAKLTVFLRDLSKDDRAKLLQFRKTQSAAVRAFFSDRSDVVAKTIKGLAIQDPQCLAEPLILYYLKQDAPQQMAAAADALASGHYRSPAVMTALVQTLALSDVRYTDYANSPQMISVAKAVKTLRPPDAAPVLLAQMIGPTRSYNWNNDAVIIDMLDSIGDKRAVPSAIAALRAGGQTTAMNSMNIDNKQITWNNTDSALYLAIRLTGQKASDYDLLVHKWNEQSTMFGFAGDKERKAAVKKLLDWWDANKDQPEYKDLKPIVLPQLTPRPFRNPYNDIQQILYSQ